MLNQNRFGIFLHADEVVRAGDGVPERRGRASIQVLSELGIQVQSVHQGVDGDVVRDVDPGHDRFEALHEVAKALVFRLLEVP
ncbi:hypothetical protein Bca4012_063315 [Brassica carinata]